MFRIVRLNTIPNVGWELLWSGFAMPATIYFMVVLVIIVIWVAWCQSWELAAFFYFFTNEKWYFCIFYKVNLTGLLKQDLCRNRLQGRGFKEIGTFYKKSQKYRKCPALLGATKYSCIFRHCCIISDLHVDTSETFPNISVLECIEKSSIGKMHWQHNLWGPVSYIS